jgi:hypothetical protein
MSQRILACGALAIFVLVGTAAAQETNTTIPPGAAPMTQPLSQRFALIVLDQFDRDVARGSTTVNMMFDTQTGRSWILEYTRRPGTNEAGYVWVEVPYVKPPTN